MTEAHQMVMDLVEGLVGQQAMPDDSWMPKLDAALRAIDQLETRARTAEGRTTALMEAHARQDEQIHRLLRDLDLDRGVD